MSTNNPTPWRWLAICGALVLVILAIGYACGWDLP